MNRYLMVCLIKRILSFKEIFFSLQCIRSSNDERKQVPIYDINSEILSLSSSLSSLHIPRSNCMLQSLSEYISPSLTKTILSSSTMTEEKTLTLTPLNHRSADSNHLIFSGKILIN